MKCEICNKEIKNFRALTHHLKNHNNIDVKKYYDMFLKKEDEDICSNENCNNLCRFVSLSVGYKNFCSNKCVSSSEKIKDKKKKTNLEKYGVENIFLSKEFQDNAKNKILEKYGVENVFLLKEFQDIAKSKMLEKHGVSNPMHSDIFKQKLINTNLEKYGVECIFENKDIQQKCINTNLEKYGVDHYSKTKEYKEKYKNTCLKKYGVDNLFKSTIIKQKIKNTLKKKYNVEYISQHVDIKNKINKTKRKKFYYNVIIPKYNSKNIKPLFNKNEYTGHTNFYKWKCKKCNNIFEESIKNKKPRCPECNPIEPSTSIIEKEVLEFCKLYFNDIHKNDREQIKPYELDIFIPEINLAIEINGLYWHSELQGKDKNYHIDKYKNCVSKGIQLIQIFEDEWIYNQDIVKSILLNKFNKTHNKIYARQCEIKIVSNLEKSNFLNNNHIQGDCISNINLGLYYKNDLVSLLTLGKSRFNKKYEYEILRFSSILNTVVIGSFSKLFKYFIDNYNPKSILTYSDLRFGSGKVYLKNNFSFIGTTKPNYYYIKGNNRYNRIRFQKHKLKNILENFDQNLTEVENMHNNKYYRIWDCGNNVYEYIL